ncbi:hypothetical protein WME99_34160 [Sorangium sp. So ce136]|uniref:hypothetical protein n=1 Tax=Sorangium sp. So ce136 TaxID=3133284 RepID=UPI003F12078A
MTRRPLLVASAALLAAAGAAASGLAWVALPGFRDAPRALVAAGALAVATAALLLLGGFLQEKLTLGPARLRSRADRADASARARPAQPPRPPAGRPAVAPAAAPPSHLGDPRVIYAYAAQVVGQSLAWEGNYKAAAASLRDIPPDWILPQVRVLLLSNLAQWQLCAGDLGAATRLLDDLDEDRAPASVRPLVRGARAAVLVRAGDVEGALSLVGRRDGERGEPAEVRQRYRITRAHALAARGELAAARAELRRVVDEVGVDELCRWLPAGGPARATMLELIDEG